MAVKKEIKIAYFPSETPKLKVLNTNGKSLDHYCTKAVTEEDLSTGNYLLDATFLAAETKDILHEEAILKVRMDYGEEVFRISKVTKGTRYIDIVARQITIADSLTLFIRDARPTNLKGQAALTWIMDRAEGVKEIEITSNIDTSSTSYYLDKNLYEVLHTADNSFIDRWGGEIQRRAYTIKINDKIGVDRGFSIREGKNLTGFEGSSNIDSLVTRAKGKGFNGIEGNFIDSDLINHYNRTYTSVIEYSDVKVKDEYNEDGFETEEEAKAELDSRIRKEFEENHIDQIKASYSINFIQLEKTEEYKSYQVAERAFIGDIVRVYIPKHDVDINVRVMKKKYDVLAQKTNEITLSNFIIAKPPTIKDVYESLESIKSENISSLQHAKEYASELIKSGLKNSYVIVREDEIIIGDTKDINTMVNVWRFNKNGLGFSSTGYYGEFGLAMTMNGAIVADFITVGVLNAALIKAGVLRSENGLSWLDMENGTFNFANKIVYDGTSLVIKLSDGQTLEYKLNSLVSEISDAKTGLNSKIEQTASAIRTEVSNVQNGLNSKIEQTASSITSTIQGNYSDLNGKITTANTQIQQNATNIQSKVDVNGVKSTIQQNPDSVRIGFNGISNIIDMTANGLKVQHGSSYSLLGANGLMRYDGSTGKQYHYLSYMGQVDLESEERVAIKLPSEFKNRDFKVIVSVKRVRIAYDPYVEKHLLMGFYAEVESINTSDASFIVYASVRAIKSTNFNGQITGADYGQDILRPVVAYWVYA